MIRLAIDASDMARRVRRFSQSTLPQIEVWALNWTAQDALDAVRDRMRVVFDRPKPWTLSAFMVWRARKSNRVAVLQRRPSAAARDFLVTQNEGGARRSTGLERLMERKVAFDGILTAVVPASAARLDRFGNWSPGERNQALSEIGAQRDDAANATTRSIARARARGRASYFVPRGEGALSPGVWKRTAGGAIAKVAHFVSRAPVYRPRLDFEDTVSRVYRERLEPNLRRAFSRAAGLDR